MIKNLKSHVEELHKFNKERIFWLRLSGFVAISILLIIVDWAVCGQNEILWILVSIGLTLSVIWWYWTMKLIRKVIDNKVAEVELLAYIVTDIKEIREDIKKLDQKA